MGFRGGSYREIHALPHPAMVSQVTGVSVQVIATHHLYRSQVMTWEAAMKALERL